MVWALAAPYFVRQNGVLQPWQPGRAGTFAQFAGFTCSLNTGSVGYTLGYENAPWLFVQSHNIKPRAPMGENCLTLAAGESVAFPLYLYDFVAVDGERTLYAALEAVYGLWHTPPRPGTTPSHAAELLAGAVTRDAWLPDDKNYVGITKERSDGSYEQNKIFSISWTNGLSAAVPCLQAAHRLGDKTIRAAALACIDNIVQNSLDPRCGLPNETWDAKTAGAVGLVVRRHVHGRAFRLSGRTDALLYPKGLSARSRPRHRPPRLARLCAGRGATAGGGTQRRRRVPVYPVGANGRRVWNTDSLGSAWCLAAEAALMQLTGDTADLPAMERSEIHYYDAFIRRAECYGGPPDTSKAVDSEGVLAYIRVARLLHELTGKASTSTTCGTHCAMSTALNSATMCPYRSRRCPASAGRAAAAASLRWPTRTFTPCPAQLPTRCSTICAAAPMPILNPV